MDLDIRVNTNYMRFFLFVIFGLSFHALGEAQNSSKNDITYTFIEALKSKTFGNYNQSAYLFKKCADLDTTCAACFYELSHLFYNANDIVTAQFYARKAYILDKSNYWYLKNYAELLKVDKQYALSKDIYNEINKQPFKRVEDQYNLAELYFALAKYKLSLKILNELESSYGISEKVVMLKYRYYLKTAKYKYAEREILKLIRAYPEVSEYNGVLAEVYVLMGKKSDALKFYNKLKTLDPSNYKTFISLGRFYINEHDTVLGNYYLKHIFSDPLFSNVDRIYAIQEIVKDDPNTYSNKVFLKGLLDTLLVKNDTIIPYLEVGCDYYEKMKNFSLSFKYAESLVRLSPSVGFYWEKYFYYANILNENDAILKHSTYTVSNFPNKPIFYLIPGLAAYQSNKYDTALFFLKKGYSLFKTEENILSQFVGLIGEVYFKKGIKDSAYYYFELGLQSKNADISLYNNYAYYLSINGDNLLKAKELSYFVITREPKNGTFLDTYAWVLYQLKDYRGALKYIKLAYKYLQHKDADVCEHYGDIAFMNRNVEMAIYFWNEAMSLNGDSGFVEKKKKQFNFIR